MVFEANLEVIVPFVSKSLLLDAKDKVPSEWVNSLSERREIANSLSVTRTG